MNTKFQLLAILIASFFFLSSSITIASYLGPEMSASKIINSNVDKATETTQIPNQADSRNISIVMVPINQPLPGFTGISVDDDGITHRFHFERVRKAKKYAGIFCCLAKIIVIITHTALLVWGYYHLLPH